MISKDRLTSSMLQTKSSSGSEFIFFLCSFNANRDYSLHTSTFQFTIFHLSECLAIINSFKGYGQSNALLLSSFNVSSIASDINANPDVTILSTADLLALEVSATLHIAASITRAGVPLEHKIMKDMIESALSTFIKVVVNPQCSAHLQKSYVNLVVSLLEILPENGLKDAPESIFINDLLRIMGDLLKWYTGEPLRLGIVIKVFKSFNYLY